MAIEDGRGQLGATGQQASRAQGSKGSRHGGVKGGKKGRDGEYRQVGGILHAVVRAGRLSNA